MTEAVIVRKSLGFYSTDFHAIEMGVAWNRRTGGYLDTGEVTKEMLPWSQVSALPDSLGIPRFLHLGHRTDLAGLYDREFLMNSHGAAGVPDSNFEHAVNAVYREVAWTGESVLEQVKSAIRLPSGVARIVSYHRLVMPCKTTAEMPAIITFTDYCRADRVPADTGDRRVHSMRASL